jgi:hypothetical protein
MTNDEDKERIQLSLAQILASSAAAASAAVLCSFFGVAGTVIGTAVASVLATVGSAVYGYSLRRTRARLRRLHQAGAAAPPVQEVVKTLRQQGRDLWSELPLRILGIGAVAVFVVATLVITGIELGLGKTLAATIGGSHSNSETSFLGGHRSKSKPTPTPTPSKSPSTTPSPSRTPSPKPTRTVTRTSTPTATPTQSPTSILPTLGATNKSH